MGGPADGNVAHLQAGVQFMGAPSAHIHVSETLSDPKG